MNMNTTNNSFMQDKVFLDDYVNIIKACGSKCIKSYDHSKLLTAIDQQCLEKCYFKSLGMNKLLSQNFGELMLQINEMDK